MRDVDPDGDQASLTGGGDGRTLYACAAPDFDEKARSAAEHAGVHAGADGRTLYACAAPDFDEKARAAAREGSVLAVRVDVPHAGRP